MEQSSNSLSIIGIVAAIIAVVGAGAMLALNGTGGIKAGSVTILPFGAQVNFVSDDGENISCSGGAACLLKPGVEYSYTAKMDGMKEETGKITGVEEGNVPKAVCLEPEDGSYSDEEVKRLRVADCANGKKSAILSNYTVDPEESGELEDTELGDDVEEVREVQEGEKDEDDEEL